MLRNYLKVALRNLRKEKLYTFLNVLGLALGLASCLLIMLFVQHEWSYDRFHPDADRIVRAWGKEDWGDGREFFYTVTPIPLAEALEASIPEVEETVRIQRLNALVGPEGNRFNESLRMVDSTFLDVFDFELIRGTASFRDPNTVVVTADIARKYFGDEDPIGRSLSIEIVDEPQDYIVTGIIGAAPAASSIQFDLLIPFTEAPDLLNPGALTNWFNVSVETYARLESGTSDAEIEPKLASLVRQVLGEEGERSGYQIGLQPITDIHLNTAYPVGLEPISNPAYSYFLAGVGVLVLLIASINFVTLSIGKSASRSGEVGVRKAMGADRGQLMRQFWGEALLVVACAIVFGILLAFAALPLFNDLTGMPLVLSFDAAIIALLLGLGAIVALLAGMYPALILSGLRPVEVLRGRVQMGSDRSLLRRGLVIVQFSISILLISATFVIARQLEYIHEKDLSYEKDHVIVLRSGLSATDADRLVSRMRAELQGSSSIVSIAHSAFPMDEEWARFGFEKDDGMYTEFMANLISPEFLETMKIDLIAGRGFSRDRTTDSTALVVNEAFVRHFGFSSPEAALGRGLPSRSFAQHAIIGVVPNFNYESLHSTVRPLALARTGEWLFRGSSDIDVPSSMSSEISVRMAPGDLHAAVDLLEQTWRTIASDLPFEYYFLDDAIDAQYRQEERLAQIIATASTLAIVIACLGLFGLATLTVVRRTKEIGIRKVLGATVSNILVLLAREFAVLVAIAFVVGAPVAFLLIRSWLDNFAYRVSPGVLTFVLAGALAMLFALITVSYQSARVALTDPVRILRYE